MVKCPECDVILMKKDGNNWECPICACQFENDLELTTGVVYMRCTCSIGGEPFDYPNDLE